MTHYRKLFEGNYLGSWDIEETQFEGTIESISNELVFDQRENREKSVVTISFKEARKKWICNKTNAKSIEQLHGTPDINEWIGKKVTLYVAKIKVGGEIVSAIRVRTPEAKLK